MSIWYVMLCVLLLVLCALTVTLILLQKKRAAGFTGAVAGMGQSQTYWDKNKGRSMEGALVLYTKISGASFMILSLVLNLINWTK